MTALPGAEVAIVGGGVIGCSIAFQLTRRGVTDVVLLERARLASGATGICPGGIRQQFETEADRVLAQRAVRFYEHINRHLGPEPPFFFERSGYLFLADSPAVLARFTRNVAMQNRLGIPSRVLTPQEIASLLPAARFDGIAQRCILCRRRFHRGLRRDHERLRTRRARAGGARPLRGNRQTRAARRWLAAARASRDAGRQSCRDRGQRRQRIARRAARHSAPHRRRTAATGLYGAGAARPRSTARGESGARLCDQATDQRRVLPGLARREAGRRRPRVHRAIAQQRCRTSALSLRISPSAASWQAPTDTTPDHRPVLGHAGGDALYVAAGFSGHGFMLAPAVGDLMADLVVGLHRTLFSTPSRSVASARALPTKVCRSRLCHVFERLTGSPLPPTDDGRLPRWHRARGRLAPRAGTGCCQPA